MQAKETFYSYTLLAVFAILMVNARGAAANESI